MQPWHLLPLLLFYKDIASVCQSLTTAIFSDAPLVFRSLLASEGEKHQFPQQTQKLKQALIKL